MRSPRAEEPVELDPRDSAPGPESGRTVSEAPPVGNFYTGRVERLSRGLESGSIRSGGGRVIPFDFAFVQMRPATTDPASLEEGMTVGFDVGWTSRGLRVTTIRIVDVLPEAVVENDPPPPPPDPE